MIKAGIRANGFIRSNREGSIGFLSGWQRAAPELRVYDSIWRGYNQDGSMPMDGFALVVRDTKELLNVEPRSAAERVVRFGLAAPGARGTRLESEISLRGAILPISLHLKELSDAGHDS